MKFLDELRDRGVRDYGELSIEQHVALTALSTATPGYYSHAGVRIWVGDDAIAWAYDGRAVTRWNRLHCAPAIAKTTVIQRPMSKAPATFEELRAIQEREELEWFARAESEFAKGVQ
jgi:hypothetical protein